MSSPGAFFYDKHSLQSDTPPETLLETLSTLSILITRFPAHFADPSLNPQPLIAIAPLLIHSRPAVRKRAISTLSQFVPVAPPELFSTLLENNILPFLVANANLEQQRTTVNLIAAIFRQSAQQLTPSLGDIVPGLLQAVKRDDDELREGCLQVAYMRPGSSGFYSLAKGFGDITTEVTWRGHAIRRFYGTSRDPVHQV